MPDHDYRCLHNIKPFSAASSAASICKELHFKRETIYTNLTGVPIAISDRLGVCSDLPSTHTFKQVLVVRVCFTMLRAARDALGLKLLEAEESGVKTPEVLELIEAYTMGLLDSSQRDNYFRMEFTKEIPLADIQTMGGSVYVHDLDIVVSSTVRAFDLIHPYGSRAGENKNHEHKDVSYRYVVEHVNHANPEKSMYGLSNTAGGRIVVVVPPIKGSPKRDGVYITSPSEFTDRDDIRRRVTNTFIELDDIEQLNANGLYGSYMEANDAVTTELEFKIELELLKRKAEEAAVVKKTTDIEAEIKSREVKYFYDEKSIERKDSSEVLKAIPSIIIGLGAIFAAVRIFL